MPRQNLPTKPLSDSYGWFLILLPLFITILALWLPFGFSLTALVEEWGVLGVYVMNGLFFITDSASPMSFHASRPLTILPHSIAYFLDQNSFDYWHILLMLSLSIKGFSFGYLIKKITGSLQWVVLAAILVVIYPADTMQMAFRGIHINWALSLQLLASCFFIMAVQAERVINYLIFTLLAAVTMFAAICMYEAAIPLLLFPFLILYAKEGFQSAYKQLWGRKILVVAWFASLGIYLFYLHNVNLRMSTYHDTITGGRTLWEFITQSPYSNLFSIGALRGLLGGWQDAFGMLFKEFSLYGYIYLLLIISSLYGLFLLTKRFSQNSPTLNTGKTILLRLSVAGFLLLLLGYLPFFSFPGYVITTQRTYLFASPGAVMVWLAFLMLIVHWQKKIGIFLSFILIFAGFAAQLFQFHHYAKISTTQRALLKAIVENYDGRTDKTLLILDKTNQLNYTWMFLVGNLQYALSYLYNHPLKSIFVCRLPDGSLQLNYTLKSGTCIEHENNWSFLFPTVDSGREKSTAHQEQVLSKKDLVVVSIEPDGKGISELKLDDYRHDLFHGQTELALRFRNILADKTWPSHFTRLWRVQDANSYQWHFGRWWGLDNPIRGNGWDEAGWDVNTFNHQSIAAWKIANEARLQFKIMLNSNSYLLRVKLANILNETVRESIKIRINDHEVPFQWLDSALITTFPNTEELVATVPSKDLLSGINSIVFNSKVVVEYNGLSFKLVSIKLSPINQQKEVST